jgi:uncharacterized membrane protein YhaH (DUF805 family)
VSGDYFQIKGVYTRVQYFASLFMAALLWGLMVLIFEGPAREQFPQSHVVPQAITITPPLLFYLFAAVKRFRHLSSAWWLRMLFLSAAALLAVSGLVWPDFSVRYAFYHRVLMALWVCGTLALLVWPGPGEKTPGFSGD